MVFARTLRTRCATLTGIASERECVGNGADVSRGGESCLGFAVIGSKGGGEKKANPTAKTLIK